MSQNDPGPDTRALADFAFGSQTRVADASRPLAWLSPEELDIDLCDPVQRRFGDYELLEKIGQGGMGVVYRARQHGLERDVALKLLAAGPWASEEFVARFRREARSAARMQHPNIVEIYEFGHRDGLNYFSMRLIEGRSLAQQLTATGRMAVQEAAALLRTLSEAMDYAHRLGVLHLDLKPANVLLTPTGTPLIADFGLARRIDAGHEGGTGEISGTPSYMAPEQALLESHPLSASTDIYGLGAVLYECLLGRAPFVGSDAQAVLERVVAEAPAAPRSIRPDVPADLEAICLKCLQKDPAQRYVSARAMADDLGRFIEGRPVSVRPLGVVQRTHRWIRREPRMAAAVLAVALALLAGIASTSMQWRRAEVARGLAESRRAEATRLQALAEGQRAIAQAQRERLRQAIGLMGILAPEDSKASLVREHRYGWDQEINPADQAQVDKAVQWLEAHAGEKDQGEILMAYHRALVEAGKPNQADALVNEVLNRLYHRYTSDMISAFTAMDTAESLAWASMLVEDSALGDALAAQAVRKDSGNQLALYAAAARCPPGRSNPCPAPAAIERLAQVDPDNAFNLALAARARVGDPAKLVNELPAINRAGRFDDHGRALFVSLQRLVRESGRPVPAILTGEEWRKVVELATGGNRVGVESLFNMQRVLPDWYAIGRACNPGENPRLDPAQRGQCLRFGLLVARSQSFPVTQSWGQRIVLAVGRGTAAAAEATEARRRYLWINEQLRSLDASQVARIDHLQKQSDYARVGELEALASMLDRIGVGGQPPAGWMPAKREQLEFR